MALEKKIIIVSKVKSEDLDKIERLAWIKKRVDNFFTIDRQEVSDIIGCCERVYFKTVSQGQMLMFIEHEAGIRTVVLGDQSAEINKSLLKAFNIMLRAAWNLKNDREVMIRDTKLAPD